MQAEGGSGEGGEEQRPSREEVAKVEKENCRVEIETVHVNRRVN